MKKFDLYKFLKLGAATLSAFVILSLAACSGDEDKQTDGTGEGTNVHINVGGKNDKETVGEDKATDAAEETPGTDAPGTDGPQTEAPGTDAKETDKPSDEPSDETTAGAAGETGKFTEDDATVTVNGVVIRIGDDFLPNYEKVGDAEVVEGQACLDGGYDTNYYYGGEEFVVFTVAEDGKQIIYDIYITSPDYKTNKGAEVGKTTAEELLDMYGFASDSYFGTYEYRLEGTDIVASFTFDESDILESIDIIDEGVTG